MSQMRCTSVRRLSRMFQGSSPSTSRITPIRIDSSRSRKMTDSGGPPKKRVTRSLLAGRWPVVGRSEGIVMLSPYHTARFVLLDILSWTGFLRRTGGHFAGKRYGATTGLDLVQYPLERFQPISLAGRLVPA